VVEPLDVLFETAVERLLDENDNVTVVSDDSETVTLLSYDRKTSIVLRVIIMYSYRTVATRRHN
jgi:hypothetical protein